MVVGAVGRVAADLAALTGNLVAAPSQVPTTGASPATQGQF